jgi:hypothetical protein
MKNLLIILNLFLVPNLAHATCQKQLNQKQVSDIKKYYEVNGVKSNQQINPNRLVGDAVARFQELIKTGKPEGAVPVAYAVQIKQINTLVVTLSVGPIFFASIYTGNGLLITEAEINDNGIRWIDCKNKL